MQRSCYFVIEV